MKKFIKVLTTNEKNFLDKLFVNANKDMTSARAKVIRGAGIFTSIQEIMERVKVLLGEMEAGNTSMVLRNELADLLHYLYKRKQIKKNDYTKLIGLVNTKYIYEHPSTFNYKCQD